MARDAAAQHATRRSGIGPSSLFVASQVGEHTQRQVEVGVEQPLDLGISRYRVSRLSRSVASAELQVDQFHGQLQGFEAWSEWWATASVVEHVEQHIAELEGQMAPFREGEESGAVAPAALADLQTGLWLARGELLGLQRSLAEQEVVAHQRLGSAPLPRGQNVDTPLPVQSPWGERPPHSAPMTAPAQAELSRAQAAQAGLERLPTIRGGVMWAPNSQDELVPFASLGISMPLQAGLAAERQRQRGEAAAWQAQGEWQVVQFEQRWSAEHQAWLDGSEEVERRHEQVVVPLATRAERLRLAAEQGLVPLSRWVQASRDAREAEHEEIRLRAELHRSSARAHALKALLETP
jgi:hypothetical protein